MDKWEAFWILIRNFDRRMFFHRVSNQGREGNGKGEKGRTRKAENMVNENQDSICNF